MLNIQELGITNHKPHFVTDVRQNIIIEESNYLQNRYVTHYFTKERAKIQKDI